MRVYLSFLLLLTGCSPAADPPTPVPRVPDLGVGRAMLAGRIVDASGGPVSGASIKADETGDSAVSGADGTYTLNVKGHTTVTLRVKAPGRADTRVESIEVHAGGMAMGFDILTLTQSEVDGLNARAGGSSAQHGVVAVTVISLRPACVPDGATITILPESVGKILEPKLEADAGVATVPGVSAFIGAVPLASTYYILEVEKAGCVEAPFPVVFGGRTHTGGFAVSTGVLTQTALFLK